MNRSATIGDLAGEHLTHIDLGDDDPRVSVEVGEGSVISVQFAELLQFHRERGLPAGIVDDDGDLTGNGRARIESHLRTLLAAQGSVDPAAVHVDDDLGDDQGFLVVLQTTVPSGTQFHDFYDRTAWPFVATMVNITDPGTFNSPYLFSEI
ncbi:MAG: hypothetical protein WAX14_08330 [Rhodococcus sp. (in: high G+C Gram-positive bacteria)]|uniref:hypothetical protein n=1 Tax=Rhodococcus sp. TaxID=1831 RepID=UPI003BB6B92B